jgi:hypothetical protein
MDTKVKQLRRFLPAVLFLALFVAYNANGRFMAGSDVYLSRFMPINLVLTGSYYPDPTKIYNSGATPVNDPTCPSHGKLVSVYHAYTPTLLAPFYLIPYRALGLPGEHYLSFYLDKWFASAIVALAGVFTFLLLTELHDGEVGLPLLITLGYFLGTSLWAVASQGSWSHGPAALYIILAIWSLQLRLRRGDEHPPHWLAWLAGWACASAVATRPTNALFAAPFALLALWELRRSRRSLVMFLLGILPVAIWFGSYNAVYFGSPFTLANNYNAAVVRIPHLIHLENFFAGFFGLLFSPSLGMFTTGPVTLFGCLGLALCWRTYRLPLASQAGGSVTEERLPTTPLQRLLRAAALFALAHTLFYSCYLEWWSDWYCYRYLIDILPILALGTGWLFRPGTRWRRLRWPLFIPAFAVSFFVQFYGAFFWGFVAYYGQFVEKPRLYLDLNPNKGFLSLFNHPSPHFSLDPRQHIIFSEANSFRWNWTNWDDLINPFATFPKIHKDLFQTKVVPMRPTLPIILYYGQ